MTSSSQGSSCDHEWTMVGACDSPFGRVEINECKLCEATNLVATSEEEE